MSESAVRPFAVLLAACLPALAYAQGPPTASPPPPPPQVVEAEPDPDVALVPAEPDFTLGVLPTTLRMPAGKFVFRMTHRFTRPVGTGDVGDFFSNLFGLDSSARVGLELRYGLMTGTQVAVHRTNERTIQLLAQEEILAQDDATPATVHVVGAVEGRNNFGLSDSFDLPDTKEFGFTIGGVISRRFNEQAAVYATPLFVFNANSLPTPDNDEEHTFMLGLGARLRLGQSRTYVFAEAVPRLTGHAPGVDHLSVGIERRAGGHMFQFNVSNALGTTMGQIARGGVRSEDWYIGFNLTRKFF